MVYRVGLENRSRETDRGFESHPLRSLSYRGFPEGLSGDLGKILHSAPSGSNATEAPSGIIAADAASHCPSNRQRQGRFHPG